MNIQLKDVDNVVFNGIDVSAVKFNDVLVWRKWETIEYTGAVPVEILSAGEPLIDYLISGNMSQTGTPTPTTPIMPQECGERTGNLFDKDATNVNNGYISNGYLQSDGSITTTTEYRTSEYIRISQNQPYTLYYGSKLNVPSVCFYDSAKNYISGVAYARRWNVPFTTPQNAEYLRLSFRAIDHSNIMLNSGSSALPYSPYGYKLDISSGDTTVPIYLGEVETTRQIKKLVLTGEENWYTAVSSTGLFGIQRFEPMQAQPFIPGYSAISNCYVYNPVQSGIDTATVSGEFALQAARAGGPWRYNFFIKDGQYDGLIAWKSYLAQQYAAGTPVTVWYVLATPTTGIVNEPLRKIGDYADTISAEQAGVSIPTVEGANVIDINTTLKPSEVYIKYKGKST